MAEVSLQLCSYAHAKGDLSGMAMFEQLARRVRSVS